MAMMRPAAARIVDRDLARTAAVLLGAAGQVLAPAVGPRLGQRTIGAVSDEHPSVLTPPDAAFAVWGPIFLACTAAAVQQALPGERRTDLQRRAGWWLAGAYAGNAAWELTAQSGRYRGTPALLAAIVGATATAHARLQGSEPRGGARVAPASTGMLLGWTSVALLANVAGAAGAASPADPRTRRLATLAVAAAGAALTTAVGRSRRAAAPLAATSAWGFGAIALASPVRGVRLAGTLATAGVLGALARRWRGARSSSARAALLLG
ncbi:hypothetical protein [Micromonospora chersina]